ncbi:hypothetical protein [Rhodoluna sp.]|uniref:hypothetical protein n=1 Tax=Rhodoluna sp. TaxID=1969481 RepID=UPI0025FB2C2E|nr:hypothetical protein [Rhodoluna sp.]
MRKIAILAILTASSIALSGCALLYPNWGTSAKPSDSASPSQSASESATPTDSASPSASASVAKQNAQLNVIEAMADTGSGTLLVVAEVTNVSETGGKCTISVVAGGVSKAVTVNAEANATATQCFPANIPLTGLPKGAAKITISYASTGYQGTLANYAVNIP